jgi:hypothetical protein
LLAFGTPITGTVLVLFDLVGIGRCVVDPRGRVSRRLVVVVALATEIAFVIVGFKLFELVLKTRQGSNKLLHASLLSVNLLCKKNQEVVGFGVGFGFCSRLSCIARDSILLNVGNGNQTFSPL